MALQKQGVDYSFVSGLDTKTDSKLIDPGKLSVLENAVFTKTGTLNKRNGYDALSVNTIDGSVITSGISLGKHSDQVVLFSNQQLHGYINPTDKWLTIGNLPTSLVENTPIVKNIYEQVAPDVTTSRDVTLWSWVDSRGTANSIRGCIINQTDGSVIVGDTQLIGANAFGVKCVTTGENLFAIYIAAGKLYGRMVSSLVPSFGAQVEIATNVHSTCKLFDVITVGSNMLVAYVNTSNKITVTYVTQNLLQGTSLLGLPDAFDIAHLPTTTLGLFLHNSAYIHVLFSNAAGLQNNVFYTDFVQLQAVKVLDAAALCASLTVTEDSVTAITVYSDIPDGADSLINKVSYNAITDAVSTPSVFARSVGIASKAFEYNDDWYIPAVHESSLQSCYVLFRDNGALVSKTLYQQAGGLPSANTLSNSAQLDTNTWLFPHLRVGRLETIDSTVVTYTGISVTVLDFTGSDVGIQSIELGKQLYIAGSIPFVYDGISIVEQGFILFPEDCSLSAAATGGSMSDGAYQYSVIYESVDQQGDIIRSAPSIAKSITLSGGGTSQKVTLTIPTLRLSQKTNVQCVIFRTTAAGTVFYKSGIVVNNPLVDSVTYVDVLTDAAIGVKELLYTTGEILDNIPLPPCSVMTSYNNRLFVAGLEDKNQIAYTKPYTQMTEIEHNDTMFIQVENQGGDITGLEVLDDKLIIFKESSTYFIKGNGPTNAGTNNDLAAPQNIAADTGCSKDSPNSIVKTPLGLMYKSNKGIYLLDRSLTTKYIGAPVQDFNSEKVVKSILVGNTNEVRFFTSAGTVLVYNYYYDQWSTFTKFTDVVGAIVVENVVYWINDIGEVYKEVEGSFLDAGKAIIMKIATGWFCWNKRQGYQRVYEINLLGKFKSAHTLVCKMFYDYQDFCRDTTIIPVDTLMGTSLYGSEITWGSSLYWGTDTDLNVYQFKLNPMIQKCQVIKISIEDSFSNSGSEGFELSNLHFVLGLKQPGFVPSMDGQERN